MGLIILFRRWGRGGGEVATSVYSSSSVFHVPANVFHGVNFVGLLASTLRREVFAARAVINVKY